MPQVSVGGAEIGPTTGGIAAGTRGVIFLDKRAFPESNDGKGLGAAGLEKRALPSMVGGPMGPTILAFARDLSNSK